MNDTEHRRDNIVVTDDSTPPDQGSFYRAEDGNVFILARITKDEYALVSLSDGNRWLNPMPLDTCVPKEGSRLKRLPIGTKGTFEVRR